MGIASLEDHVLNVMAVLVHVQQRAVALLLLVMIALMLRRICTAAWWSLLWALAALSKLRWSVEQYCSTCCRHASGSASRRDGADPLSILWSSESNNNACRHHHAVSVVCHVRVTTVCWAELA